MPLRRAIQTSVVATSTAVCLGLTLSGQAAAKPSVQDFTFMGDGSVRSAQDATTNRPHIGISIRKGHVVAYLCDGNPARRRLQRVGEWFIGRARRGRVSLRSRKGARLRARIGRRAVTGSVRLASGRVVSFRARRATRRARFLFVIRPKSGQQSLSRPARTGTPLLGWIRLPRGAERGTFTKTQLTSATCTQMSSRLKYLANKQQSATLTAAEGNEYNRLQVEYATQCSSGTGA